MGGGRRPSRAVHAELAYHARAVFAVEEAIGHYEQARTLLKAQKPLLESVLSAPEVKRLSVSLGRAYGFQNAWPKAQETLEELLALRTSTSCLPL